MESQKGRVVAFARERGVVRPKDLAGLSISPSSLRRLVEDGLMHRTGRGLYTLAEFETTEAHTLVEAARVQPNGVVCLLSALAFHGLGTQLPPRVWLAVPHGARISRSEGPPRRVVVVRGPAYEAGIEVHRREGVDLRVYGIAKTVADLFKFRNTVGLDVALEALKEALAERRCSRDEIRRHARIDRVERVMTPYLEALAA